MTLVYLMDNAVISDLIARHNDRFGHTFSSFAINLEDLNEAHDLAQRLQHALDTGEPVTDEELGIAADPTEALV